MFASLLSAVASHRTLCFMVTLRNHATLLVATFTKHVPYLYRLKQIGIFHMTRTKKKKQITALG